MKTYGWAGKGEGVQNTLLVPSEGKDAVWHYTILNTRDRERKIMNATAEWKIAVGACILKALENPIQSNRKP